MNVVRECRLSGGRVIMQFSFTNGDAIPKTIFDLKPETSEEGYERKERQGGGQMVIEPIEHCSISQLPENLEKVGYTLTGGVYQQRVHPSSRSPVTRHYHMVRFLFALPDRAIMSGAFFRVREIVRLELQAMCDEAAWRFRAFSNPWNRLGVDERAMSINLEARHPYKNSDGEPIIQPRNGQSDAIKVPYHALHDVTIEGGKILVVGK